MESSRYTASPTTPSRVLTLLGARLVDRTPGQKVGKVVIGVQPANWRSMARPLRPPIGEAP